MDGTTQDPKRQVQYLREQKVPQFINESLGELVKTMPEDALPHIIRSLQLQRRAQKREDATTQGFLTASDVCVKAALLVAIEYDGEDKLAGTYKDALKISQILTDHFNFDEQNNFFVLTDGAGDMYAAPTKANIMDRLAALVAVAKECERAGEACELIFFYSGHGARKPKAFGGRFVKDETDGFDEALVALGGEYIRDNELYMSLISQLPSSARLLSVMDCCHSGTNTDLPYRYDAATGDATRCWTEGTEVPPTLPRVIQFAASQDGQTSINVEGIAALGLALLDGKGQGAGPVPSGVLTSSLCDILKKTDYDVTLHDAFRYVTKKGKRFGQNAVMTAAHPEDFGKRLC